MTQAIGAQIGSFLEGFYEIIPHELISLFDEYELVSSSPHITCAVHALLTLKVNHQSVFH